MRNFKKNKYYVRLNKRKHGQTERSSRKTAL